jgi:hypothetical protein
VTLQVRLLVEEVHVKPPTHIGDAVCQGNLVVARYRY